jgi:uncharacterized protein
MLDIVLSIILLVIALAAVSLNVVSLPGNWVILAAGLAMSIYHGGHQPNWVVLVAILVVLLGAELIEFLSGMVGARKFGASKAAAWAAIAGAVIGGLVGVPPITLMMLGVDHLFAAVAGAFLAAWMVELLRQRPMKEASLAALGAALGRGTGLAAKIGAGVLAWVILLLAWLVPLVMGW